MIEYVGKGQIHISLTKRPNLITDWLARGTVHASKSDSQGRSLAAGEIVRVQQHSDP